MRVLGIDEAGRGGVIGPIVMTCLLADTSQYGHLTRIGVKDSKAFKYNKDARAARAIVHDKLLGLYEYRTKFVHAPVVDKYVAQNQLDTLEREMAEELVRWAIDNNLKPDAVVFDSYNMFNSLAQKLSLEFPNITFQALDKADDKIKAVSAASIIAKHQRDEATKSIMSQTFFSTGAGYPNPGTEEWIRSVVDPHSSWDQDVCMKDVRQSWKWWHKLQKKLKEEGYGV